MSDQTEQTPAVQEDSKQESWEWDRHFLKRHEFLKEKGVLNEHRTRVIILSGTVVNVDDEISTVLSDESLKSNESLKKDAKKAKHVQADPHTCNMVFKVFDLGEHFKEFRYISFDERKNNIKKMI